MPKTRKLLSRKNGQLPSSVAHLNKHLAAADVPKPTSHFGQSLISFTKTLLQVDHFKNGFPQSPSTLERDNCLQHCQSLLDDFTVLKECSCRHSDHSKIPDSNHATNRKIPPPAATMVSEGYGSRSYQTNQLCVGRQTRFTLQHMVSQDDSEALDLCPKCWFSVPVSDLTCSRLLR